MRSPSKTSRSGYRRRSSSPFGPGQLDEALVSLAGRLLFVFGIETIAPKSWVMVFESSRAPAHVSKNEPYYRPYGRAFECRIAALSVFSTTLTLQPAILAIVAFTFFASSTRVLVRRAFSCSSAMAVGMTSRMR